MIETNASIAEIEMLLEGGANVNAKLETDNSAPLMYAVAFGRLELCELLISIGANVDARHETGTTALMPAAAHGHFEIVKLVIENLMWRR